MEINRLGPRGPHTDNPAEKTKSAQFPPPASGSAEPGGPAAPAGVPSGVTPADLRDPAKTGEILDRCFTGLVDNASTQLGVSISSTQKQSLVEFLGNDPVLRGKLLTYLDQAVK